LLYGRERRRAEARYKAARALFQLLASIPYQKCRQRTLTRPETWLVRLTRARDEKSNVKALTGSELSCWSQTESR